MVKPVRTKSLNVRIAPGTKKQIQGLSDASNMTASEWLRLVIEEAVGRKVTFRTTRKG